MSDTLIFHLICNSIVRYDGERAVRKEKCTLGTRDNEFALDQFCNRDLDNRHYQWACRATSQW